MITSGERPQVLRVLVMIAALMVIMGGLRAAAPILEPFLLAVFISIIAATPLFWLQQRGVPTPIALVLVVAMIIVAGGGVAALIATSLRELAEALPIYDQRLRDLYNGLVSDLRELGLPVSRDLLLSQFDTGTAVRMLGRTMSGLGGLLSNAFLILLTVIFILLEARSLPRKLEAVLARPDDTLPRFTSVAATINRYMAIKTSISIVTGLLVYGLNAVAGVDFPVLWAVLAFLLNYVPNIGSFIAAIPAVLLAGIQHGVADAALVAAGYFAINTLMGNGVEPRFMGRGLGLSPMVVWLSLVFWGWALGPVGMLLSVPLTVTLRIALESRPDTHWIAVLLGPAQEASESHLTPPEPPPASPVDRLTDVSSTAAAPRRAAADPARERAGEAAEQDDETT